MLSIVVVSFSPDERNGNPLEIVRHLRLDDYKMWNFLFYENTVFAHAWDRRLDLPAQGNAEPAGGTAALAYGFLAWDWHSDTVCFQDLPPDVVAVSQKPR